MIVSDSLGKYLFVNADFWRYEFIYYYSALLILIIDVLR